MGYGHPYGILISFAAIACFVCRSQLPVRYTLWLLIVFHGFSVCPFDMFQSFPWIEAHLEFYDSNSCYKQGIHTTCADFPHQLTQLLRLCALSCHVNGLAFHAYCILFMSYAHLK